MGAQVAQMDFGCPGSGEISQIPIPCVSAGDSRDVMMPMTRSWLSGRPGGGLGMGCSCSWSDPAKQDWSRDVTHS